MKEFEHYVREAVRKGKMSTEEFLSAQDVFDSKLSELENDNSAYEPNKRDELHRLRDNHIINLLRWELNTIPYDEFLRKN